MRRIGRLLGILAMLIVLYTVSMLCAYAFPDEWINPRISAALDYLEEEGNMPGGYANYFWHSGFGITDNLTDKVIFQGLMRNGRSVADAAMRTDYSRYWHGYAVILRPLSIKLSILHIRFLNMIAMVSLLMLCYYHARRRLGWRLAFAFVTGLVMSFLLIAPFCQQYCPVTLLCLASCYALLRFWEKLRKYLPELFLLIGSLVCFFDFLTFPVLALGYPLIIALLLSMQEGMSAAQLLKRMLWLSTVWMGAYVLTWLSKALSCRLLTDTDALKEILKQVAFRTAGAFTESPNIEVSAYTAVAINLDTFFTGFNTAFFGALTLLFGAGAARHRLPGNVWKQMLPIAAVALYPFLWYCVLQNHTRMHFWMTYKQLSVTVFAVWAALLAVTRGGLQGESKT